MREQKSGKRRDKEIKKILLEFEKKEQLWKTEFTSLAEVAAKVIQETHADLVRLKQEEDV